MNGVARPLPSLNFQEEASMDSATISRVMDLIPERVARVRSGTAFAPASAGSCRHPERLALVMQHLHWLTPLTYLTKDEQQQLGLLAANGRLMHSGDQDDDLLDDLEDVALPLPEMAAEEQEKHEAALMASPHF
jgi:hypothetical protein